MASIDAFLKLDGIKGESQDKTHKGEIDLLSFSWSNKQTGTAPSGGGMGAGKVHFSDLKILKKTDASSPLLFQNCAAGKHIPSALLTVRKAGGSQLEYMKIKLTDLVVSSYHSYGSGTEGFAESPGAKVAAGLGGGASEIPLDEVSLNFSKIEFQYQPQGKDGAADGGANIQTWDVKGNTK